MIHLYALGEPPPAGWVGVGVDDVAVEILACGDLHAAVSRHERPVAADRPQLLAHAAVVEALSVVTASVPVRFGVRHVDEPALMAAIEEQRPHLYATLDRVAGRAELVLRSRQDPVVAAAAPVHAGGPPEADPAHGSPGRTYLRARLAEERATQEARSQASHRLRAATADLDAHAVEVAEILGPGGPERCLLVDRGSLDAALQAAGDVAVEHDLVLGGPWPPYTFAAEVGG